MTVKALPAEGLVSCKDLAEFFQMRADNLKVKLAKNGIKTSGLSTHSRFRLVNVKDLLNLK